MEPIPDPSSTFASSFGATAPERPAALARQRGESGGGREGNPALRASRAPRCDFAFPVHDYDLDATPTSGQVFGWERDPRLSSGQGFGGERCAESGMGVVDGRWVK